MMRLNALGGKSWLKSSKSVWYEENGTSGAVLDLPDLVLGGALRSDAPPRDDLKKQHPATFSEKDIAKLIRFFSKPKQTVLDPFMGTGSTALACQETGRNCIGIELYADWLNIARKRIKKSTSNVDITLMGGDSFQVVKSLGESSVDFLVTSPPYWNMLGKLDHKAKQERIAKSLPTDYGNNIQDLGNTENYTEFLAKLTEGFLEYHRVLKSRSYMAIVVSDFRHGPKYYMLHAHVSEMIEGSGFTLQGLINLVQDNKRLYPYGFPTTYVPNISNQFIVIGRKL